LLAQGQQAGQTPSASSPQPYDSIAANKVEYDGPERGTAYDLPGKSLHIVLLVPLHGPQQADGNAMVIAAQMAIADSTQRPLPGGRSVTLALGDESGPAWGHTAEELLRLVMQEQSVAVIAPADGDVAHLGEQVCNKVGLPILTLSSDETATEINIPWVFRIGPSDGQQAQSMARAVGQGKGQKKALLIVEDDHDGRVGADAVRKAFLKQGLSAPDVLSIAPLHPDPGLLTARLHPHPPQAILIWTQPETAGKLLQSMAKETTPLDVYLSCKAAQTGSGMEIASSKARQPDTSMRVWVTAADSKEAMRQAEFARRYQQKTGERPSAIAAGTYDAVSLVVLALRRAGPNRARVRDQIAATHGFPGVSGTIDLDSEGNDRANLHLVPMVSSNAAPASAAKEAP
jgi:branched-chain amino acid transport system substrate-binding protein